MLRYCEIEGIPTILGVGDGLAEMLTALAPSHS